MITGHAPAASAAWPFAGRHAEIARFAAALADPQCRGFAIRGAAGTGKTTLAGACLDLAGARGLPFVRVDATVSSSAVPLASVAHLMAPELRSAEPVALFNAVSRRLEERVAEAGADRLVLLVDDISLLDPTSLALIATVTVSPRLFLVTTDRDDRPEVDLLSGLWRAGRLAAVDLEGFDRRELDRVLHIVLQAPVAGLAAEALWSATTGNPLFLRELVHEAVRRGVLCQIDGVWQLVGDLEAGPRLLEFVEGRLRGLGDSPRGLLDRIAVCGPLPLSRALELVDVETLSGLESNGLVAIHSDGSTLQADVAHPVHRQALRRLLPVMATRRLLLDESDRFAADVDLTDNAMARLVSWRLAAGAAVEGEALLRAARLARYAQDLPTVLRMTETADPDDLHALSLRCEALYLLNRHAEAVAAAGPVLERRMGGPHRGPLLATSAMALFSGLARFDDAVALVERELSDGAPARDEALALLTVLHTYTGRLTTARELAARVVTGPRTDVHLRLVASTAAATSGDGATAAVEAVAGAESLRALGDAAIGLPHPLAFVGLEVSGLVEQGRLDEAAGRATAAINEVTSARGHVAPAQLCAMLAGIRLSQGRTNDALQAAREAVSAGHQDGIGHGRLLGWATAVQGLVMSKAQDEAMAAARRMRELPSDSGVHACVPRAEAWLLAGAGELGQARDILVSAATTFDGLGQPGTALGLLGDAVRFGSRGLLGRMSALAAAASTPWTAVRVAHATAADGNDVEGLVSAAAAYAGLGYAVHEAECLTLAATVAAAGGESRRSRALATRAAERRATAGNAWTPGLVAVPAQVPLTAREHEIAVLAAAGQTSPAIAGKLFLSVRTVDNHLRSVYSKTGAKGREDLAELMDLASG